MFGRLGEVHETGLCAVEKGVCARGKLLFLNGCKKNSVSEGLRIRSSFFLLKLSLFLFYSYFF